MSKVMNNKRYVVLYVGNIELPSDDVFHPPTLEVAKFELFDKFEDAAEFAAKYSGVILQTVGYTVQKGRDA